MTRKEKQAAIERLDKSAIQRIVDQSGTAERVHINGIGHVPVKVLRAELKRR